MGKFISVLICFVATAAGAQDLRGILDAQAAAWNRGDLAAFVETYENSPSITFLGKTLSRGRGEVLARYKRTYDTAEKMANYASKLWNSGRLERITRLYLASSF